MRKSSIILFVGAASLAAGCINAADEASDPEVLNESTTIEAIEPGLTDELVGMLNVYAHGLERGDAAAVEKILSSELRSRIAERAPGADVSQKTRAFVLREQKKLAKNLGALHGRDRRFTVTSAQKLEEGQVVALKVAIDGEELPKPFYFVAEDGGYKLNVAPPTTSAGSDYYQVKNGDYEPRTFTCSGSSEKTIAVFPSQVQVKCLDTCSGWFTGTEFATASGSATCDYNTWGIDMTIQSGNPICSDYC